MDMRGFRGYPWIPWIFIASMDIHRFHGYPWNPWISKGCVQLEFNSIQMSLNIRGGGGICFYHLFFLFILPWTAIGYVRLSEVPHMESAHASGWNTEQTRHAHMYIYICTCVCMYIWVCLFCLLLREMPRPGYRGSIRGSTSIDRPRIDRSTDRSILETDHPGHDTPDVV